MSLDQFILQAFASQLKSKPEFRYFELVSLTSQKNMLSGSCVERQVYLLVGRHALHIFKANMSRVIKGGKIEYAWIQEVVLDTNSASNLQLVLNADRPSTCDEVMSLKCEHRAVLLNHISISYLADVMTRKNVMARLPQKEEMLSTSRQLDTIKSFKKYKQVELAAYRLFVHEKFEPKLDEHGAYSLLVTKLLDKSDVDGGRVDDDDDEDEDWKYINVKLQAYKQVPLLDLPSGGREHIRWAAQEYKEALIVRQETIVRDNQLYMKKMNLSNDPALWTGWEFRLEDNEKVTVVVMLRRQYVPPLLDMVQDFAIEYYCSKSLMDTYDLGANWLAAQCHLAADTLSCQAQHVGIYPEMLQAKLDGLLFDEEAYAWIQARMRLCPSGKQEISTVAHIFLRGILKILVSENVLNPEISNELTKRIRSHNVKHLDMDADPMCLALDLRSSFEGLPRDEDDCDEMTLSKKNAAHARLARYLAHCVDGGILGSTFKLDEMILNITQGAVTSESANRLNDILYFLLHFRPKNLKLKW